MARFFIAGTNFPNGRAIIRGRDADHIRVLRLRAGDDIVICDGAGRDYKCRLVQTLEHEAEAEVIEVVPCKAEPTVRTTVFAGLPKGERSDFLVQKCTEAGAAEIVFFSCTRCVAKAVNMEKKLERWQRIAEEAAKQSGRGIIPQVRYEADFVAVLNDALHTDLPLFMYETGERETIRDAIEHTASPIAGHHHGAGGRLCRVRGRHGPQARYAHLLHGRAHPAVRDGSGRRAHGADVRHRQFVNFF